MSNVAKLRLNSLFGREVVLRGHLRGDNLVAGICFKVTPSVVADPSVSLSSDDSSDIAKNHFYDVSSLYPRVSRETPDTGNNKNSKPV